MTGVSRRDAVLGALFILASAVIVAKLADRQFDRFFYGAASMAAVLLAVSRHRLVYVAAAFAWMGLRLFGAGILASKWWALGLGALFAGIAYAVFVFAESREEYDSITKYWRR